MIHPVEQTTFLDKNVQDHQTAMAKPTVEAGDLTSDTKEAKPSLYFEVYPNSRRYNIYS
jgi:hypothetical protein